jgi:hypothetical protein
MIDDDVSIDELRETVEHMHRVQWWLTVSILSALSVLVAAGCKPSGCDEACSCPGPAEGPGWCSTTGPAPCCCQGSMLCPGWCLVPSGDSGSSTPAPCDAGAEE